LEIASIGYLSGPRRSNGVDKTRGLDYNWAVRFTFIGGYDPSYPRNAVIRKGLLRIWVEVEERRAPADLKFWARYPVLALKRDRFRKRSRTERAFFFVPEFRQKDVPLAKALGILSGRKVVFDPLAARYETKIVDWRRKRADSPSAWWNKRIDAAAFRLADLVLADTSAHKDYYCRTYRLDPAKVEVLPLGFDDDLFKPAATARGDRPGPFQVLFFGSFLPLHGAEAIIEAARIVAGNDPEIRFVLLGEGQTYPAVREAARGLKNVVFLGRRDQRDLPALIAASDLCLGIFGRTEKARRVVPHKLIQSMAMGRAVVTARTSAVEEFFRDREHLFLCREPFPESLAATILELERDRALAARVGRNGRDLVRRDFSPEAIARRLVAVVRLHFGFSSFPSFL
jgi:glycosyltransferase involved in cell wall biosynthesis